MDPLSTVHIEIWVHYSSGTKKTKSLKTKLCYVLHVKVVSIFVTCLNLHHSFRFFPPDQDDPIDLEMLLARLEYQMDGSDQNNECQAYFNSYLRELSGRSTFYMHALAEQSSS